MRRAEEQVATLQAAELEAQKAVEQAQEVYKAAQVATAKAQQELQAAQQALDRWLRGVEELARLDDLAEAAAVVDLTCSTEEEDEGFSDDLRQVEQ